MKYYLIKAEETSNGLIETLGELEKNKVVELTQEELESTQLDKQITIKECANYVKLLEKIRKVLDNGN